MHDSKKSLAAFLLSAAGLGLSAVLTYIHIRVHLDPSYVSLCAVGKTLNCETVAASPYSVVMGIPLSVLGGLYYLFFGGAALSSMTKKRTALPGTRFFLSLLGASASVFLLILSSAVIKALCLLCMATYLVNFLLAALAFREARILGGALPLLRSELQQMKKNPLVAAELIALAILLLTAGPLGGFPRYWELASWQSGSAFNHGVTSEGLPWLGATSPSLTIEEYFDYECPACRISHKKLRKLLSKNPDKIRIVRHDMPRVSCAGRRREQCPLAKAAHCAGIKGRYWDFNDAVIAQPKPLFGPDRKAYEAEMVLELGFDSIAFERCMSAEETAAQVASRQKEGKQRRVSATPTYFVDGRKLMGLVKLLPIVNEKL